MNKIWLNFAGYPKKDIDKLCRVVLDKTTQNKFKSGVDLVIEF